jgi:hypothetical protein
VVQPSFKHDRSVLRDHPVIADAQPPVQEGRQAFIGVSESLEKDMASA